MLARGRADSLGDPDECLVPEQGPTWLGAGWAWEEALGAQEKKMNVTQWQKHLRKGPLMKLRDGLEAMALRVSPHDAQGPVAGQSPSQMGSPSLGSAQSWERGGEQEGTAEQGRRSKEPLHSLGGRGCQECALA